MAPNLRVAGPFGPETGAIEPRAELHDHADAFQVSPFSEAVVGVVHPVESVSVGIATALRSAGFTVQQPDVLRRWALDAGDRLLVHPRVRPEDSDTIRQLMRARPSLAIVALIDRETAGAYRQAFRAGCVGVVPWTRPIGEIVRVIAAGLVGCAMMPREIAASLASVGPNGPPDTISLSSLESTALRMLASGARTTDIARECAYSEREVFRILGDLYGRIGVSNRAQAIAAAARWGLLDDCDAP